MLREKVELRCHGEPVVGVAGGRPSRAFIVQEGRWFDAQTWVVVFVVIVVGRSVV
jgi:hypothetical protein